MAEKDKLFVVRAPLEPTYSRCKPLEPVGSNKKKNNTQTMERHSGPTLSPVQTRDRDIQRKKGKINASERA